MEPEHHLANGSSMHEDQAGDLAVGMRQKQLAVQREAIFAPEDDLLRSDQRRGGEVSQSLFSKHLASIGWYFVGHRWNGGSRTQTQDVFAVSRYDGKPFNRVAFRDSLLRRPARNGYAPQVAAVNVILIGGKDQRSFIWSQRDIFHVEVTSGEQRGSAAGCGDGIQVIAAVLFGGEHDASIRGKFKRIFFSQFGKRVVELV